jgi:cholesterol transport system auxiliary component
MAYRKRPYEVEYYGMSQWADAPARLLLPLLVHALSRSGAWGAVIPAPGPVRGDYRLDSYGLAVRQEFFQRPSRVWVTVRMQLVDVKEPRIVGVRMFEAVEDAPSEDAYGGVTAANRAAAALLGQVATWAEGCLHKPSECNR